MIATDPKNCMKCGRNYGGGCIVETSCPYCRCEEGSGHKWRKFFDNLDYKTCTKCDAAEISGEAQ